MFANVPTNLYRHLILSDLKEVAAHLPAEYGSTATYTFDPIPPKNSIISYTRPARTAQANSGSLNRAEGLITFFQSLLPSFNAQVAYAQIIFIYLIFKLKSIKRI